MADKKFKIVLNGFIEIRNYSKLEPNNLWVDQERKWYWYDNLMYSTYNEKK